MCIDHLGQPTCELWSPNFRFPTALGLPTGGEPIPAWRLVPYDIADFDEWAYVRHDNVAADPTRAKSLLYRELSAAPTFFPVKIRFQGFVAAARLAALGNWNGAVGEAKSARQDITLRCGDATEDDGLWESTMRAVDNVKDYIYCVLGAPSKGRAGVSHLDRTVFAQRRVFTKVCVSSACRPLLRSTQVRSTNRNLPSALREGDDPHGICEAVAKDWKVTSRLSIGRLAPSMVDDNRTVVCDHTAVKTGDFVDIGVSVEIVTFGRFDEKPRVDVHFCLEHVLLLRSADVEVCQITHFLHIH
ncbi:hypothetical protein R3P38DRAFT_2527275 [Favolaschia claudopus]|uniref:Uncharacterized protein n=1 Tax=Favolaschia claudopus TaxID=2862362 RepID=A0AAW0BJ68_9AGAR